MFAAAAALAMTAGCGGAGGKPGEDVVTVTVTPTPGSPAEPSADAPSGTGPRSDVTGRRFDLGKIVKIEQQDGRQVLIFDRWTAKKVKDADVAQNGLPVAAFSDVPFENKNTTTTFRIPVADGAMFTYHHCTAVDEPLQSRSVTLQQISDLGEPEDILLVSLDDRGYLTRAENEPGC